MFQALIHSVETQEDITELCCLSVHPFSYPLHNKVRKSESQQGPTSSEHWARDLELYSASAKKRPDGLRPLGTSLLGVLGETRNQKEGDWFGSNFNHTHWEELRAWTAGNREGENSRDFAKFSWLTVKANILPRLRSQHSCVLWDRLSIIHLILHRKYTENMILVS